MTDPSLLPFAAAALAATAMASGAALRAWSAWLDLNRERIAAGQPRGSSPNEVAELRARVRRLEAIATGSDS